MECENLLKEICTDLSEDIDSELCQRLRSHLQVCPDCRQQLNAMRNTVKLYNCLREIDVPGDIHQRLAILLNMQLEEKKGGITDKR